MLVHRNARLGPAGRREVVRDIEGGCSLREAARRRGVAPATAHRWWQRWRCQPSAVPRWAASIRSREPLIPLGARCLVRRQPMPETLG
jgi:transposase-like protein